ncbi:uncharacterized protein [Haliaeetus albicilla]|uniref:uncharacterized protein n=1 Tax=Haliaeetus albicilla TaxID=8969 RepID=UPI0037E729BB
MGSTMSKEEAAVVKLLQHMLSTRGLSYDSSTLKALLLWAREKGLLPTFGDAFAIPTWEKIGQELWQNISSGSKEASRFSTMWRLIIETLKSMKAERSAAVSAFAALGPEGPEKMPSSPALLFQQPQIPAAVPARVSGANRVSAGTCAARKSAVADPEPGDQPLEKANSLVEFPPPAEETGNSSVSKSCSSSPKPVTSSLYPPLPPSTPPSPFEEKEERATGLGDTQLREMLQKLEALEARLESLVKPEPASSTFPAPPPPFTTEFSLFLRPPPTNPFTSQDVSGEIGAMAPLPPSPLTALLTGGGVGDPANRWKGVIRDALIEGQFIPFVTGAHGGPVWEALDWKVLKEAKAAITQYGLKSPYSQSIIQHVFSAHLLTPYDVKMIVQMLLLPSQQLQFYQNWQAACENAAAIPRQQGDPLFGVQAQMLLGAGPYTRSNWQA